MEKPAKSSNLFKTGNCILKGKAFRRENSALKQILLRFWMPPRVFAASQSMTKSFSPEVSFANRSTERDCHLVVPSPAVPCLLFVLNCTGPEQWFTSCLMLKGFMVTVVRWTRIFSKHLVNWKSKLVIQSLQFLYWETYHQKIFTSLICKLIILAQMHSFQTVIQKAMAVMRKTRSSLQGSQHQEICEKSSADDSLQSQKVGVVLDSKEEAAMCLSPPPAGRKAEADWACPLFVGVHIGVSEFCPSGITNWVRFL